MCYVTALIPLCKVKLKIKQLQSKNVVGLLQTNGHPMDMPDLACL